MQSFTAIRTNRLTIDRLTFADIPRLVHYKNDVDIALHQTWPMPFTGEAAERFVAEPVGNDLESAGQLALRTLDGELIGDMRVHLLADVTHTVELGITLAAGRHGHGYASEAIRGVVNALFAGDTIHKVMAYVALANEPSLRLFDSLGFIREGLLRDSFRARNGELITEVLFGLTRAARLRPTARFDVIAFDADDTLWHSEDSFVAAERRFVELVSPYVDEGIDVSAALAATERRNLHVLGYGVKAFGLSMLETAAAIAPDRLAVGVMSELTDIVKHMLMEPVRLLVGVAEVLAEVGSAHRLVLITKGDLVHQSSKVSTSGLAHHFEHVEIVMEKDPATYARIIASLGVRPERFCMVGNSVRSDILPVLALGASAVHVPYPLLWDLEQAPHDHGHTVAELQSLAELPRWLMESTTVPSE